MLPPATAPTRWSTPQVGHRLLGSPKIGEVDPRLLHQRATVADEGGLVVDERHHGRRAPGDHPPEPLGDAELGFHHQVHEIVGKPVSVTGEVPEDRRPVLSGDEQTVAVGDVPGGGRTSPVEP